MRFFTSHTALAAVLLAALSSAAPFQTSALKRQDAGGKLVFAHFMVGIVPNRQSAADYDADMKAAKAAGIDAFALNIGTDDYTEAQLGYAYESAANNGMKVFISFDFAWFPIGDAGKVGALVQEFGGKDAQLKVDGKAFVSSFNGDGFSAEALRSAAGMDIYFAPNFHPEQTADPSSLDGALNWVGWDSDGANRAPKNGQNVTVAQGDEKYGKWLGTKGYIAPVSPWFSTHYGPEVSYSKNWVFPGDLLWYNRWNEILQLSPPFLEIITWNDYGESHYVGPLSSKHTDDGNSKWANDMPHNGWLEMAKPFIAAYKAGKKDPAEFITEDKIVYWYRPTPKTLDCDSTDTAGARPDGFETMEDAVFVVALLKDAGKVTAVSGENSQTFDAPAGASAWKVAMGVGKQQFSLERGGQQVFGETSLRDVADVCPCGLYNYNAYVGTVPSGAPDFLDADGLTNLVTGLKVTTCSAAPSLPTTGGAPAATIAPAPASDDAPVVSSAPLPTSEAVLPPASSTPEAPVTEAPAPTSGAAPAPTSEAPSSSVEAPSSEIPASSAAPGTEYPAVTPTAVQQPGAGGCTATITASSQIFPTNCLASGQVWGGSDSGPDYCDGASRCS